MSLMMIVGVAAVAGVGSFALWSDSDSSEGNSVVAGSLDLVLADTKVSVSNTFPGDSGVLNSGTVENDGSINGTVSLSASTPISSENNIITPELPGDETSEDGELCKNLTIDILYGDSTTPIFTGTPADLESGSPIELGDLAIGATENYTISYSVPSTTGNEIMTDGCEFDVVFTLEQDQGNEI